MPLLSLRKELNLSLIQNYREQRTWRGVQIQRQGKAKEKIKSLSKHIGEEK